MSKENLRPCLADGKKALLHMITPKDKAVIQLKGVLRTKELNAAVDLYFDRGLVNGNGELNVIHEIVAIVEFEDGHVKEVKPTDVVFLDTAEYIKEESKEEVDWSKVPVDTKILVRNDGVWHNRYFAKYDNDTGEVYAFASGKTSFTAIDTLDVTSWDQAKLYKEGE